MAAQKKSGARTVRDMLFTLSVIVLVAGVIYLFIPHDESQDPVKPVNYGVEVKTARRAAPYPVAAPEGLPEQWRATSVRYRGGSPDGAVWHLGFMTPSNEYAAVEQSDAAQPSSFIDNVTQGAHDTGRTQRIEDERWVRYEGDKYDALVREQPEVTTVVTGTASFERLAELAAALEAGDNAGRPSAAEKAGDEVG